METIRKTHVDIQVRSPYNRINQQRKSNENQILPTVPPTIATEKAIQRYTTKVILRAEQRQNKSKAGRKKKRPRLQKKAQRSVKKILPQNKRTEKWNRKLSLTTEPGNTKSAKYQTCTQTQTTHE